MSKKIYSGTITKNSGKEALKQMSGIITSSIEERKMALQNQEMYEPYRGWDIGIMLNGVDISSYVSGYEVTHGPLGDESCDLDLNTYCYTDSRFQNFIEKVSSDSVFHICAATESGAGFYEKITLPELMYSADILNDRGFLMVRYTFSGRTDGKKPADDIVRSIMQDYIGDLEKKHETDVEENIPLKKFMEWVLEQKN